MNSLVIFKSVLKCFEIRNYIKDTIFRKISKIFLPGNRRSPLKGLFNLFSSSKLQNRFAETARILHRQVSCKITLYVEAFVQSTDMSILLSMEATLKSLKIREQDFYDGKVTIDLFPFFRLFSKLAYKEDPTIVVVHQISGLNW